MSIYHFSAQIIGRSKNRSVLEAAAYRSGTCLVDPASGREYDYTRKSGVEYSEVFAPFGAPDWVFDRQQLWASIEKKERRRDAQLARELEISIPHELSEFGRSELVYRFVEAEFTRRGMIADVCFHKPSRNGDQRNHHVHILLPLRRVVGDGWGPKVREWNDRKLLRHWREKWAEMANAALAEEFVDARIDHRSNLTRGIQRRPGHHLGPHLTTLLRTGRATRHTQRTIPIEGVARGQVPDGQEGRCFELFREGRWRRWMPPDLAGKVDRVDIQEDVRIHMADDEVVSVADGRIAVWKGQEDAIGVCLATASALHWVGLMLEGSDSFIIRTSQAAVLAGWPVKAADPEQELLVARVVAALGPAHRRLVVRPRSAPEPAENTSDDQPESPRESDELESEYLDEPCPTS